MSDCKLGSGAVFCQKESLESKLAAAEAKTHELALERDQGAHHIRTLEARVKELEEQLNQFSVHGTDGCKNCETGRITVYAKKRWCLTCLAYNDKPGA